MTENGYEGDWRNITEKAARIPGKVSDRLGALIAGHQFTVDICKSERFGRRLRLLVDDIGSWLSAENESLLSLGDHEPVTYTGGRVTALLKAGI